MVFDFVVDIIVTYGSYYIYGFKPYFGFGCVGCVHNIVVSGLAIYAALTFTYKYAVRC